MTRVRQTDPRDEKARNRRTGRGLVGAAVAAGTSLGVASAGALIPPQSGAATTHNLAPVDFGYGDQVWNYDFDSSFRSPNNVDWPMTMLFWGGATVQSVGRAFGSAIPPGGDAKYAYIHDSELGFRWDSMTGRKRTTPGCSTNPHIRYYAPPVKRKAGEEYLWNPKFQYFVVASTHWDKNEGNCAQDPAFGWSESAETVFAKWFLERGYSVVGNGLNFENEKNGWDTQQKGHYWQSNGWATSVKIPCGPVCQ